MNESDLFSQFPDVYIDGPTANDSVYFLDLLQDLFAAFKFFLVWNIKDLKG